MPWLAYCSSAYFANSTNIPAPWLTARDIPLASIFSPSITNLDGSPGLPSSIAFRINDKKSRSDLRGKGWLAPTRFTPDGLKLLDFCKGGYLEAAYTVNSVTNVAGLTLPAEFALTVYPIPQADETSKIVNGKISSVFGVTRTNFLPKIQKNIGITDSRFRDYDLNLGYLNYPILAGHDWISTQSSDLDKSFAVQVERARIMSTHTLSGKPQLAHWCAMGFITLVMVLPVLWFALVAIHCHPAERSGVC